MRPLLICAREELTLALRSRWTQIFAIVFALLSLGVAWSGYILTGGYGAQDFARTSASLIQLVILVVPLASLVIGVLSIATERGAAEMLFAQPVSRRNILFGQMLGIFAALAAAEAIGFGIAGIVIFSNAGREGIGRYLILIAGAILLTAVFVAIAASIGAAAWGRRRAKALALALVVWFVAIVLFDLAALGVASFLSSGHASRLLVASVIINPVDAIRTGALFGVSGTTAFGAASLAFLRLTKGASSAALLLAASVIFWIAVPTAIAVRRLQRSDL